MKTIGITLGDPAGVGPEVLAKALRDRTLLNASVQFLIFGSRRVLERYTASIPGHCRFVDFPEPKKFIPGKGTPATAQASLAYLDAALKLLKTKTISSLVTGPVSKEGISAFLNTQHTQPFSDGKQKFRSFSFPGHTEYLANAFKIKKFGMLFVAPGIRVLLLTRHIPLKEVPHAVTMPKIMDALLLAKESLKKHFKIARPAIGICGLNPHAGEAGKIGLEEKEIIIPAIKKAKSLQINVSGPYPADTLFYPAHARRFDLILAMYHDQALAPLKTLHFHELVNVTIGLPFIRTSPAHGTAFALAGKNTANASSMTAAIKLAGELS